MQLKTPDASDETYMRLALRLARRGLGRTSPNPAVGAVIVKGGRIIGQGWHHRAGMPHAEIEAFRDAAAKGESTAGATLYVTLEPCSTHGRTPPCTDAIVNAGISRVVAAAADPNPRHQGAGFDRLRNAGIEVAVGVSEAGSTEMNAAFNHWIVHRTPWVTLKAAMTLDGKTATSTGESKWITSEKSRAHVMRLRAQSDAIVVGVGTVVADDPSLTIRIGQRVSSKRRIVLDPTARMPLTSKLVSDAYRSSTVVVSSLEAPADRIEALEKLVKVMRVPQSGGHLDLRELMKQLGADSVTSLLVEGGGRTHARFLESGLAHRIAFFYAPKIFGGREAPRAIEGEGAASLAEAMTLQNLKWRKFGPDLFLSAEIRGPGRENIKNI
jgi:diaminohydroxyphosphoribosylaminopyrimidine deaminase/5-amino-6-(5-phosphoribosylamino)uracil reductase